MVWARRCILDGIWWQDGDEWWRCLRIGLETDLRRYLLDGMIGGIAVVLWDVLQPRCGDLSPEFGWDGDEI